MVANPTQVQTARATAGAPPATAGPIITPERWMDAILDRLPLGRHGTLLRLLAYIVRLLAVVGDDERAPIDEDDCEHRNRYGPPRDIALSWAQVMRDVRVKTERTARRLLAELVDDGWLEQLEPPGPHGAPGRYRLAVPADVLDDHPWSEPPGPRCERCLSPWPRHGDAPR